MKEVIRIMGAGLLSVIIATIVLKIAVNLDDSTVDKIGEVGKNHLETYVETTVYPKVKVVDPADNIKVYFGNTILYTEQRYSLHGVIYAMTVNGEMLDISFVGVYNKGTNAPVLMDDDIVVFYSPGVYKVLMTVMDEKFEMDIPVAKRWKL